MKWSCLNCTNNGTDFCMKNSGTFRQKKFYSYPQNQWINRRKSSSRIKERWTDLVAVLSKYSEQKKILTNFSKFIGKLYKCSVHLSICELEKYIVVSHLRHSITDIYYLALESYSLKFCYARKFLFHPLSHYKYYRTNLQQVLD